MEAKASSPPSVPSGEDDSQSGDGADDDGVDKDLKHAPHGLFGRLLGRGSGVGDGGGAQTGLVGEHAAGKAVLHRQHDGVAENAAADGPKAESVAEDGAEGRRKLGNAHDDQDDTSQNVENSHKGNQVGGHLADTLNTAQNDDGDQNGKDDTDDQADRFDLLGIRNACQTHDGAGDLAGLGNVADAEGGQTAQDGEDDRQPLPVLAQAVFNVVHGAALVDAVLIRIAELHGQGDLGVLGAHAEEGGYPHPEHSARAAHKDRAGNAGDVAGAHGAGQGGGHRLEGGQVAAVILVLLLEQGSDGVFHDVAEFAHLNAAGTHRQEDTGADQEHQHDGAPGKAVDGAVDICDDF